MRRIKSKIIILLVRTFTVFATLVILSTAWPDQFLLPNLREAQQVFWNQLYAGTNYTLYCGEQFNEPGELAIEFVYPIPRVVNYLGCGTIEQCRTVSGRFNRIEADLHNMYPVLPSIERVRDDFQYGIIPGEFRDFFECDFEIDVRTKTIEPRPVARGNIARAVFYMHWEYGLPISGEQLNLLKQWHAEDPPSQDERRRNDIIEKLQGTRNRFIDNPKKADALVQTP